MKKGILIGVGVLVICGLVLGGLFFVFVLNVAKAPYTIAPEFISRANLDKKTQVGSFKLITDEYENPVEVSSGLYVAFYSRTGKTDATEGDTQIVLGKGEVQRKPLVDATKENCTSFAEGNINEVAYFSSDCGPTQVYIYTVAGGNFVAFQVQGTKAELESVIKDFAQ